MNKLVFDCKPQNFAPKLERFTENAERFTIAALCHCFLSRVGVSLRVDSILYPPRI